VVDIVITANNVTPGTNSTRKTYVSKEVVTAGQGVALDTADKKVGLWDSNSPSAWKKKPLGVALNGAQIGQPVVVHEEGRINIGATVVVGTAYFMSDTPGGICPMADVGTGENSVFIGIATLATELSVKLVDFNVTVP
jgi:tetrahydrodipicolinate N-succinyltransferase